MYLTVGWPFDYQHLGRMVKGFGTEIGISLLIRRKFVKDDYTQVPRRLKKKWKARERNTLIVGWVILLVASMYLIGLIAEQFDGQVDWP